MRLVAMLHPRATHYAEARDGTRIAWHVHLADGRSADDLRGRPTVLLTNGVGTSENFWRHLVQHLRAEHRVVHWDYRGHGMSEPAKSGDYSMDAHVDDLLRVIDALGEPRPIHVAFSMGVPVTLELFRRRPEAVPAAALIAGASDPPGTGLFPWTLPGVTAVLRKAMDVISPAVPALAPPTRWFLRSGAPYPIGRLFGLLRPRAPREDIEQMMRSLDPVASFESTRALMRWDVSDVLPRFRVPALIIAARNDKLMPLEQVRRMRDRLPHAMYLEVDDAGHANLVEASEEVVAAVRRFVDGFRKAAPSAP